MLEQMQFVLVSVYVALNPPWPSPHGKPAELIEFPLPGLCRSFEGQDCHCRIKTTHQGTPSVAVCSAVYCLRA